MKRLPLLLVAVLAVCVVSCRGKHYKFYSGAAEGTSYHIIANNAPKDMDARIAAVFAQVDSSVSIYNPDSRISRINRNEDVEIDSNIIMCIGMAHMATVYSKGAYDITIKPLVDAWGFGPESVAGTEPTQQQLDSIVKFVGSDKYRVAYNRVFKTDPRVQFDLSSVAKGYSVDLMCDMLTKAGVKDYLVEIGGEVRCKGVNSRGGKWRVGIDNPEYRGIEGESQISASLGVSGEAVATSGDYRQFYIANDGQKVVHIIDARTGKPILSPILSATVVSDYCSRADAMATMLMTMTDMNRVEHIGRTFNTFGEFYLIYRDSVDNKVKTYMTPGMKKFIVDTPIDKDGVK